MPVRKPAFSDESGFTLMEVLVVSLLSVVVALGAINVIEVAFKQTTVVAEKVSATQRGRVGMEYILNTLHSSCVAVAAVPVVSSTKEKKESDGENLYVLSQQGTQAFFTSMTQHRIYLSGGTLYDASYKSTGGVAPKWTFSSTPSSTRAILSGVSKSGTTPIFRYYKYESSTLPETELTTPLSEANAKLTAQVKIAFSVEPEKKESTATISRSVELSDTALLRFDPASTTSQNTPCT